MKKLWIGALAMVLLLSLCGCGGDTAKSDAPASDSTTTAGVTTTAGGTTTTPSDGDTQTTTQGQDTADTTEVPATTTQGQGTTTTAPTTTQGQATTTQSSATTTAPKPPVTTTKPVEEPTPTIVLPAVGTDIDVVNKKDRIHVTAATAVYDDNGDILVALTLTNDSDKWITEESNYVCYTAYDKEGGVIERNVKIHIGVIDTKKNPTKTYTFTVPGDTAEIRLTNSKIVYWTEWT